MCYKSLELLEIGDNLPVVGTLPKGASKADLYSARQQFWPVLLQWPTEVVCMCAGAFDI